VQWTENSLSRLTALTGNITPLPGFELTVARSSCDRSDPHFKKIARLLMKGDAPRLDCYAGASPLSISGYREEPSGVALTHILRKSIGVGINPLHR
jgi:hypothetical protein